MMASAASSSENTINLEIWQYLLMERVIYPEMMRTIPLDVQVTFNRKNTCVIVKGPPVLFAKFEAEAKARISKIKLGKHIAHVDKRIQNFAMTFYLNQHYTNAPVHFQCETPPPSDRLPLEIEDTHSYASMLIKFWFLPQEGLEEDIMAKLRSLEGVIEGKLFDVIRAPTKK
jgi:hypothetical protein